MDIVALAYYALICGLLAGASTRVRSPGWRMGIGALVGILAAALLPYLKNLFPT